MKKIIILFIILSLILTICVVTIHVFSDPSPDQIETYTQYDMDIEIDTNRMRASVLQTVKYYNNTDANLEYIVLNLYPYVYSKDSENLPVENHHISKTYYNGINYGGIIILRVYHKDRWLDFDIKGQLLYVNIDIIAPLELVEFTIKYHVLLPEVNHRLGFNQYTINLANFYPQVAVFENGMFRKDIYHPIGDPFYSDMANYRVRLRIPINYIVAASAKLIREDMNISTKTQYYEGTRIRDFAIVMSDKFSVVTRKANNTEVFYYYYQDPEPDFSLNAAVEALTLFGEMIGEYPYDIFSVVETEFVYGGMEYSQLIMISSSLQGHYRERVIVHETAHQWWYNIVGNNSIDSAWMDEGLTEFTTLLYYIDKGQNQIREDIISMSTESYVKFNKNRYLLEDSVSNNMNRSLDQFMTEYEYVIMVYCKGMLMFNSIYEIIGHDKFIKALRLYYDSYKYSIAKEEDLIAVFCKVDRRGLEGIFHPWLEGHVVIVSPYQ